MVRRIVSSRFATLAPSAYAASSPVPAKVRVNVLPVIEDNGKRTLGKIIAVDADATTSILELKQQLSERLANSHPKHTVPSVYAIHQPLTPPTSAAIVSDLVVRRENYLRVTDTVASCITMTTSTSRRQASDHSHAHVVALVISTRFGRSVGEQWHAECIEQLMHCQLVDKTLPRTLTCRTPSFIREDAVKLYGVICELLDLSHRHKTTSTNQLNPPQKKKSSSIIVTGSPGAVTMEFLWFLFHKLSQTHILVLDMGGLFLLTRPDGTIVRGDDDRRRFARELDHPETIYMTYKTPKTADFWRRIRAKAIIAADPDREVLKQLDRAWLGATTLYMPMWSLSDVMEYRRRVYQGSTDNLLAEEVKILYDHFGGSPRDIVRVKSSCDVRAKIEKLHFAINFERPEDVHLMWSYAGKEFRHCRLPESQLGPQLMHVTPSSDFRNATVEFATQFVRREMTRRREELVATCWCSSHPLVKDAARYSPRKTTMRDDQWRCM